MIPLLAEWSGNPPYPDKTKILGALTECANCVVKEDLSGKYELELTYPNDGPLSANIQPWKLILAVPNRFRLLDKDERYSPDIFMIYKITVAPGNLTKVYAEHISYILNRYYTPSVSGNSIRDCLDFMGIDKIPQYFEKAQTYDEAKWYSNSDFKTTRQALYDMAAFYGGVVEYTGLRILITRSRARATTPWTFFYGRNMKTFREDVEGKGYAEVLGYYKKDSNFVKGYGQVRGWYPTVGNIVYPVDFTDEFSSVPPDWEVAEKAQAYADSHLDELSFGTSISLTVEPPAEMEERGIYLGDPVNLYVNQYGIGMQESTVEGYEFNVLTERYNKLSIGVAKKNLANVLVEIGTK